MIALSRGLKWRWLGQQCLIGLLAFGTIKIYGGTRPTTPDSAADPGQLLGSVTADGLPFIPGVMTPVSNGLVLSQPVIGVLANAPGVRWVLTVTRSGTATWFRYQGNTDDPGGNDPLGDFSRIDGDISATGIGDGLYLVSTTLTAGVALPIGGCFLTFED